MILGVSFLHHVVLLLAKVNAIVCNHLFSAVYGKNDIFILTVNQLQK
jgi:hypothetical protein